MSPMTVETTQVESVLERATALGLSPPTFLALLPRNFFDADDRADLIHESNATTIRKLWKRNKISETPLEPPEVVFPVVVERSADWVAPTVFVSSMLLTSNPALVSLAIGVIANYATDFLKGRVAKPTVRLDVVVETTKSKSFRRISYTGPVDGLNNLPDIVREVGQLDDTQ